jgi:hypothetical protein
MSANGVAYCLGNPQLYVQAGGYAGLVCMPVDAPD